MSDESKTKKQLIAEIQELRKFIGEILNDNKNSLDLTDLTMLKDAFRQMKKNQEKFMKAFLQNALPMGLASHRDGCFIDVNDAFLRISGFKRDDVVGSTVSDLGLISDDQRFVALEKLNNNGRIENLEIQIKLKNGLLVHGLLNAVLMTLGKEKYRLIVVVDITDHRQAESDQYFSEPGLRPLPIDRPMPWFIG